MTQETGPAIDAARARSRELLVGPLPLLGSFGAATCRFGFGFLLRGVTLSLSLVLLGLALFGDVATAGHRADSFLGLTLDVLDDALQAFLRPAFLRHGIPPNRLTFMVLAEIVI